jgi:hypothetical protein
MLLVRTFIRQLIDLQGAWLAAVLADRRAHHRDQPPGSASMVSRSRTPLSLGSARTAHRHQHAPFGLTVGSHTPTTCSRARHAPRRGKRLTAGVVEA